MNIKIQTESSSFSTTVKEKLDNGVYYFDINLLAEIEIMPEATTISFNLPSNDVYSTWSPSLRGSRSLAPVWWPQYTESRLALWAPIHQLISHSGQNRYCISLSDAETPLYIKSGIVEEDSTVKVEIKLFTLPTFARNSYSCTLRIDTRNIPFYSSIKDTVSWWENDCGYKSCTIPEDAMYPMDSLWYSFHQNLSVEGILAECKEAVKYGMKTVIIDDGWQTDDVNRGYAYCGDWEVAPKKMGDMKKLVDGIHETGMKVILWYSVPNIGVKAKRFPEFKDMILDCTGDGETYYSLDPRYKKVRDYLSEIYISAVKDYGIDGLKLDFIDAFGLKGKSVQKDSNRDIDSLEKAIDSLLNSAKTEILKINPDIMIEFRQAYIGPAVRKYGNIIRVTDCPCDTIRNRCDIIDLRLLCGNTPVHCDMLMWDLNAPAEKAAKQLASCMLSVPQISVKLDSLPDEHKKMLRFLLGFWNEHRETIVHGSIKANNPETCYSKASCMLNDEEITEVFQNTILLPEANNCYFINASDSDSLYLKAERKYNFTVYSCTGQTVSAGILNTGINEIHVPESGILALE